MPNLTRKKLRRMNKGSNFLGGSFRDLDKELQTNFKVKDNPSNLKDDSSSKQDPSIFNLIASKSSEQVAKTT